MPVRRRRASGRSYASPARCGSRPRPREPTYGVDSARQRLDLAPVALVGLDGIQQQLGAHPAGREPRYLPRGESEPVQGRLGEVIVEVPHCRGQRVCGCGFDSRHLHQSPEANGSPLAFFFAGRRGFAGVQGGPADSADWPPNPHQARVRSLRAVLSLGRLGHLWAKSASHQIYALTIHVVTCVRFKRLDCGIGYPKGQGSCRRLSR